MWTCVSCGNEVDDNFETCWNCQTDKDAYVPGLQIEGEVNNKSNWICATCGVNVLSEKTICPNCGTGINEVAGNEEEQAMTEEEIAAWTEQGETSREAILARAVMKRYKDAYLAARLTTGFGKILKTIGVALAILISFITVFGNINTLIGFNYGLPMQLGGLFLGGLVGVIFYIWGIVVSAKGQLLMVSLDSAVDSSPFLSNEQRAKVMSLPKV
ncbi:MAG TPA: hypothetical protein VF791_13610 [Pyrinomonadaceae bacterium]